MIFGGTMLERRIIAMAILCLSLIALFTSLLQIKSVVEPTMNLEMDWDKRFPGDSATLPGIPDGIVQIGLFSTKFDNALVGYKEYSVTVPMQKVSMAKQITREIPLNVSIIQKVNLSDVLLSDIVSAYWASYHQDNVSVNLGSYPPGSGVKKSLVWDLNYSAYNPGFHQISYRLPGVEDWSDFDALVLWVRGTHDPSLLLVGIGSQDGWVGWYRTVDHVAKTSEEWTMLLLPPNAPDQASFNASSVTSLWAMYYVQGTQPARIYLSNFYLSNLLLSDIVSADWTSYHRDVVSVAFGSYPHGSYVNKSLVWDLNYSAYNPGFHQISYGLSMIEDWSDFDALAVWVKGAYDPNLLSLGVGSQDGRVGWYNAMEHIANSSEGWAMLLLPLRVPDHSSFDASSVTSLWAMYYVQGTQPARIYLSNFYLSNLLLGDIVSARWVSWHRDNVSVNLGSYPPGSGVKKSLVWDLNYSAYNPGFHQISYRLPGVEDWSDFDALVLWVKGAYDPSLLLVGVSSQDGWVGWYSAAQHTANSSEGWTMLLLPLSASDQARFNASSVTSLWAMYYVQDTGPTRIWLSNIYFAETDLVFRKVALKNETLFGLPMLTSQIETETARNWTDVTFDIILSQMTNLTENSYIVMAARVLGYADVAKVELVGVDVDGTQRSSEIIDLPQDRVFFLKIIRLRDKTELRNIATLNKILVTYGCGPNKNMSISTQFMILNIVEGMPTIDGIPLDSAVGGTLKLRDIKFPHRFSWTVLKPLEIYIASTIHELNMTRQVTLASITTTWQISYSMVDQVNRILARIWFNQANDAPIASAKAIILKNQSEELDLDFTQAYLSVPIPSTSEGVRISIIFNYWPSPWAETALISCTILFVEFTFFVYKRIKSSHKFQ